MAVQKEHKEFHLLNLNDGWSAIPGYPAGMRHKVLAGSLDEANKRGARTRLLRIEAGSFSTKPFVHDYWEEVYVISGDLVVGSDDQGRNGQSWPVNTYACRPPGVLHGPFTSRTGCTLLEMHYYDPA